MVRSRHRGWSTMGLGGHQLVGEARAKHPPRACCSTPSPREAFAADETEAVVREDGNAHRGKPVCDIPRWRHARALRFVRCHALGGLHLVCYREEPDKRRVLARPPAARIGVGFITAFQAVHLRIVFHLDHDDHGGVWRHYGVELPRGHIRARVVVYRLGGLRWPHGCAHGPHCTAAECAPHQAGEKNGVEPLHAMAGCPTQTQDEHAPAHGVPLGHERGVRFLRGGHQGPTSTSLENRVVLPHLWARSRGGALPFLDEGLRRLREAARGTRPLDFLRPGR
mmetsp:Transcript_60208/g.168020  ORF Transcript_60208/g.168020 Transcript_60208/m.168020 type:complete len:281 (+) Transcript_60208:1042-1884(+)